MPVDTVQAYGEAKIQLHLPFTSALNEGDKINSTEIMKFFIVASDLCGQEYRTGSSDSLRAGRSGDRIVLIPVAARSKV